MRTDLKLTYKGIILFSLPTICSTLLEPVAGMVDTALIGRFDTKLLAELALAATLMTSFTWIFNFLVHAPLQTIASTLGQEGAYSENFKAVKQQVKVSLYFCFIVALGSFLFLYFSKSLLYKLMGVSNELALGVNTYFVIRLIGHPFTLLFQSSLSILRAFGRVNIGFFYIFLSTILNIVISYSLIYHFSFGIAGAAWGTVISQILGFIVCFKTLNVTAQLKLSDWLKNFTWSPEYLSFGKKSLNIFLRSLFLTSAFFIATKVSASLDLMSISAHQIMTQFWLTLAALMDGFSASASIYCARLSEVHKSEQLKLFLSKIFKLSFLIGVICSLVFYFGKTFFLELYTKDPSVIVILSLLWWIMIVIQPLNALTFILDGIMFGLGKFAFLRKNMIVAVLVFFIPFAYYSMISESLLFLWIGFCAINLWRFISNIWLLQRSV